MQDNTRTAIVRKALLFEALIIPVALAGIVALGVEVHSQGLSVMAAIVYGVGAAAFTFALLFYLTRFQRFFRSSLQRHVRQLQGFASGFSLPGLLALAALAGIGEELLFRGLIQGWVAENTSDVWGVAVASFLFGLAHFLSPAYFVIATLMGAALGAAYVFSESILLVIVWHGVYDLIALVVLTRSPRLLGIGDEHD